MAEVVVSEYFRDNSVALCMSFFPRGWTDKWSGGEVVDVGTFFWISRGGEVDRKVKKEK